MGVGEDGAAVVPRLRPWPDRADSFGCPVWVGGGERKKVPEGVKGGEVGVRAKQEEVSPSVVAGPREWKKCSCQ